MICDIVRASTCFLDLSHGRKNSALETDIEQSRAPSHCELALLTGRQVCLGDAQGGAELLPGSATWRS